MIKPILAAAAVAAMILTAPCLAAPPGMSEVDEFVAKMQIQELLYRYALYNNSDDPEAYAALFTEDADFMGTVTGRDAILKMARDEVRKLSTLGVSAEGEYRFGFLRSHISNPVIDIIDSTHAKSIAYLQVVVPDVDHDDLPRILGELTYQDEYRKVDGKWLIAKRRSTRNSLMKDTGLGAKLGLGAARRDPTRPPDAGAAKKN